MSNPKVRPVGDLADHDGMTVIVGVDYDAVTIHRGIFQPGGGIRFTAAQLDEFRALLDAAEGETGDDEIPFPLADIPMVCTSCRKPVERAPQVAPELWRHVSVDDAAPCRRTLAGPVKAMVAAGNENVPPAAPSTPLRPERRPR